MTFGRPTPDNRVVHPSTATSAKPTSSIGVCFRLCAAARRIAANGSYRFTCGQPEEFKGFQDQTA